MNRVPMASRIDDLRLLALSRIARCKACPRFRALREARRAQAAPASSLAVLPAVPANCKHQVCAPIASRYGHVQTKSPLAGPLRIAGNL